MNYQSKSVILANYYENSIKSMISIMKDIKEISSREETILTCLTNIINQKPHEIFKK